MKNKILIIFFLIFLNENIQGQDNKFYYSFFDYLGYSCGLKVGGTTGFSGNVSIIHYKGLLCPYLSTELGVSGFESKFGFLLYGTAEGQRHDVFRNYIAPHLLACTLSINYSQLWTMDNQKNLLLGFSKEKRSVGLELGLTFYGINYKIGCYKGKSNPFFTHTIGLFFQKEISFKNKNLI